MIEDEFKERGLKDDGGKLQYYSFLKIALKYP